MDDFWDGCVILSKNVRSRTPPKVSMDPLFAVSRGGFFFECSCLWIFVILSAQRLHCGSHFDPFLGALGLFENS